MRKVTCVICGRLKANASVERVCADCDRSHRPTPDCRVVQRRAWQVWTTGACGGLSEWQARDVLDHLEEFGPLRVVRRQQPRGAGWIVEDKPA